MRLSTYFDCSPSDSVPPGGENGGGRRFPYVGKGSHQPISELLFGEPSLEPLIVKLFAKSEFFGGQWMLLVRYQPVQGKSFAAVWHRVHKQPERSIRILRLVLDAVRRG
jgi:hypothetical protein